MINQFLFLPQLLQRRSDLLCGADRSVLNSELWIYSQRERRVDTWDYHVLPFPEFTGWVPACAQRRKVA